MRTCHWPKMLLLDWEVQPYLPGSRSITIPHLTFLEASHVMSVSLYPTRRIVQYIHLSNYKKNWGVVVLAIMCWQDICYMSFSANWVHHSLNYSRKNEKKILLLRFHGEEVLDFDEVFGKESHKK
jgi:hypothetical protein